MSNIFGKPPQQPKVVKQQQPQRVEQTDEERKRLMKEFAKRKRATMLSQLSSQVNIRTQKLGAGV